MAKKKNDGSDEFVNFFAYGVAGIITVFMWMVRIILFIPYLIIKFIKWIYNKNKNKDSSKTTNVKEKVSTDKSSNKKDDIVYDSLEDWQKKEVDEGNYDSYNFEEEELEEDDYYNEDDE
ncbi:MAG: OadG family protein [Bacilli bacterium]|nr:OadG family protein [Bacilli bacterium]